MACAREGLQALYEHGARGRRPGHGGRARRALQSALSSALHRPPYWRPQLAGGRPDVLRRPRGGRAPVVHWLFGRRAVGRERNRQDLVCANEVAPVVPSASGRAAAGHDSKRRLRRSRLLASLRERARALGFDACRVTSAEPPRHARERLASWLAEGAHGDMAWMAGTFERRGGPPQPLGGATTLASSWPTRRASFCSGSITGPRRTRWRRSLALAPGPFRSMRAIATITMSSRASSKNSPPSWSLQRGRKRETSRSSLTRRRCSRSRWLSARGSAGKASTPIWCRAISAPGCSWARSSQISSFRPTSRNRTIAAYAAPASTCARQAHF